MAQPAADRSILSTYLSQGFAVFPVWGLRDGEGSLRLCACPTGPKFANADKRALDAHAKHSHGKHPHRLAPNGFKNASRDPAIVAGWGRASPGCNWAISTGDPLPGGGFLLVLDVDPRNGGDETLKSICAMQGALPATPTADTGGDGEHYLFRTERPMTSFSIGPGLETRGAGGYICVEPSMHASGGSYTWRIGRGLEDLRIAEAPTWLVESGSGSGGGEGRPPREGDGSARDTILGEAFALSDMLGAAMPDGCVAVRCPWAEEHSDARGRGQDSSTVILPPAGGRMFGGFSCKHGHCANRKWTDVLGALPLANVEAARRKFPMRPVVVVEPEEDGGEFSVEMQPTAGASMSDARRELLQRLNFKETKSGHKIANDPVNIATILAYSEEWKDVLSFDEFSQVLRFTREPPWHPDDAPGVQTFLWTDSDAFRLVLWFKRYFDLEVSENVGRAAAVTVAFQNAVNPLKTWLEGLAWDGTKRLDSWLPTYLGATDNQYTRMVGTKWMISAVARALRPGCKADHVLILEGPQGKGKSTALEALTGKAWFTDTPIDIGSKDAYLTLRGKWIIELAELASINKSESDKLKAFFSSPADTYRPPYGREMQTVPRSCVFAGTVNLGQYLRDETGNRRYWPVVCGVIDLAGIQAEREQLWAEARERFRAGETWWPETQDERDMASAEQEEREVSDPWAEDVAAWLLEGKAKELYVKNECLRVSDITERALGIRAGDLTTSHSMRIANTMRQIGGWHKGRRRIDGARAYVFTHYDWDRELLESRRRS